MKSLIAATILAAGLLPAATIENVAVSQRWPWSQKVDISYDLATDAPMQIDVAVFQGDTPVPMPAAAFSGDINNVSSGSRHIVFDPSQTPYTNRVMTALRFVLTPREMPLYLILDLSKPKTDPEQTTWVTAYDLTNSASAYGSWEWGSTFHPGSEIDSRWEDTPIWTGVTNNTAYMTYKLVMRYVPPGTFQMGMASNPGSWTYDWWELARNVRTITLTKGFYAAVFPTTRSQHSYLTNLVSMGSNNDTAVKNYVNYDGLRGTDLGTNWPVSASVDVGSTMGILRAKTGFEAFDLPTEAQWEYACRAGATGLFHDGTSTLSEDSDAVSESLDMIAWYIDNTGANHYYKVPGQKLPNGWGLYDMLGNANEWCLDWGGFNGNGYLTNDTTDPKGRTSGDGRIARGGSVWSAPKGCNCAYRLKRDTGVSDGSVTPTLCYRIFMTVE